jgi:hypothetical protein
MINDRHDGLATARCHRQLARTGTAAYYAFTGHQMSLILPSAGGHALHFMPRRDPDPAGA